MDDEFEKQVREEAEREAALRRQPKKKPIHEMPESLAPVAWSSSRPRPFLTPVWDERTAEELAKYIDWHKRHPHCVTPRINENAPAETKSKLKKDPENPGKVFTDNNIKLNPLPPDFFPTYLGVDCDVDEVSSVAIRTEYDELGFYMENNDDPWYIMSVKDHLEQSHMDGSHTTVKTKQRSKTNGFNKEQVWKGMAYSDYEGGNPRIGDDQAKALYELALRDKSAMLTSHPKKKVSPWAQEYKFSKFTEGGTALDAFKQKELGEKVSEAIKLYEVDLMDQQRDGSAPSSKSKKGKRKQKEKIVAKTPVDEMKDKLGGPKHLEKVGLEWVKLAKNVAKKSKIQKSLVDTTIDLAEACEKLRVIKAASLLYTGQGDANMLTADDEPLFLHTFQRANRMDSMSNSLRPGDEKTDSPDRLKLQKLLDLLVKFEANINTIDGKEGFGVVHYASILDNTKLLNWLIKNKADLNVCSRGAEVMTAMMLAAKYGNVYALAELVKGNVDPNITNDQGMGALHYAAMFGQTRAALFLMRIGANKKAQTLSGKTAAALAQDGNFLATAQAIAAYAVPDYKAGPQLEYIIEEEKRRNTKIEINSVVNFANAVAQQFIAGAKHVKDMVIKAWKAFYKVCRRTFYRYAQIDIQDENENDDNADVDVLEEKLKALSHKIQEEKANYDGDKMITIHGGDQLFIENSVQPFEENV